MMGKKKRKKEGDDDTNKRKKRMKVSEVKELERRTEKISKLQEKRIQKYEEKIQKAKQREELYKSLSQVQLKEDQAKYMHSSRTLGKKETKKEKLKRAVLEEKAGLERSDPQVNVFVPREINTTSNAVLPKEKTTKEMVAELPKLQPAPKLPKKKKVKARVEKKSFFTYVDSSEDDKSSSDSEEAQTVQLNSKPSNANNANNNNKKPEVTKKEEKSPGKPAEKPVAAKPVESKLVEVKPVEEPKTAPKSFSFAFPSILERKEEIVVQRKVKTLAEAGESEMANGSDQDEDGSFNEDDEEMAEDAEDDDNVEGDENDENDDEEHDDEDEEDVEGDDEEGADNDADEDQEGEEEASNEEADEKSAGEEELALAIDDEEVDKFVPKNTLEEIQDVVKKTSWGFDDASDIKSAAIHVDPEERKRTKAFYVHVQRTPEIIEQRNQLPIIMEEQRIMEAVIENDVVIICGETGSGKTTQVPQFLYEAGYSSPTSDKKGLIGITEPRRVAALSMAKRVALELNLAGPEEENSVIAHQVRYDSAVSKATRMKFMTDGILLREIQSDFLLNKYSAIIIDEAHERSLNTDILLGLLSRIVPLRRKIFNENKKQGTENTNKDSASVESPLKLIIMSATLRVSDFTENALMFPKAPPVISIGSRQYPVTIHFNKTTPMTDYVGAAYTKVCKIHQQLPSGGVLVFLTGQQEVEQLCRMLRKRYGNLAGKKKIKLLEKDGSDNEDDENKNEDDNEAEEVETEEGVHVLPLYSLLPPKQQMLVFDQVPEGKRLIVVATNVAETSITIPGIKYVVDAGRVKQKHFDKRSGVSKFVVEWTSQAAANQRAGRAGRTGPGHCYRLYSSALFTDQFPKFSPPEILTIPIEGVILQMKHMAINKVDKFPFPTAPDRQSLKAAHQTLINLGALNTNATHTITPLGRSLVFFPVAPRFAKMILLAQESECLDFIIAIVAILSVNDPFIRVTPEGQQDDFDDEEEAELAKLDKTGKEKFLERKQRQKKKLSSPFANKTSDLLSWLAAIGAYEFADQSDEFCDQHGLHVKTMKEIHLLRSQLTNIIRLFTEQNQTSKKKKKEITFNPKIEPPTREQKVSIRQIVTAGFIDRVAKRIPATHPDGRIMKGKWKYITVTSTECAIHPSSFMFEVCPEYVTYHDIFSTGTKCYIKGVTAIHPDWLPELGPTMCSFSKPLDTPAPRYNAEKDAVTCWVTPTFGPGGWMLTHVEREYPKEQIMDRYKYFARFFLEGLVCTKLAQIQPYLNGKPSMITQQWTQNKIAAIIQPFLDFKIDTKKKLLERWKKDSKFLLKPVLQWVDDSKHQIVSEMWPPTDVNKKGDNNKTANKKQPVKKK
jgi:ATP-dependent RNA helicase DHX37/DHR1